MSALTLIRVMSCTRFIAVLINDSAGPGRQHLQGAPVFICPVARPTARSARKLSSVSPDLWEAMTPHVASCSKLPILALRSSAFACLLAGTLTARRQAGWRGVQHCWLLSAGTGLCTLRLRVARLSAAQPQGCPCLKTGAVQAIRSLLMLESKGPAFESLTASMDSVTLPI